MFEEGIKLGLGLLSKLNIGLGYANLCGRVRELIWLNTSNSCGCRKLLKKVICENSFNQTLNGT